MDKEKQNNERQEVGTKCTKTMHKNIIKGMKEVTDGDCWFVRRRLKSVTGSGEKNNCFENVEKLVDRIGGEALYGWKLTKNKILMKAGIYNFAFHCIWRTPENKCVDVTMCDTYGDDRRLVFWHDTKRYTNTEKGWSYNLVTIFKSYSAATMVMGTTDGLEIKLGKAYWSTKDLLLHMPLEKHNGIYRYLHDDYKKNRKMFEKKYGVKIPTGELRGGGLNKIDDPNVIWDWGITRRF